MVDFSKLCMASYVAGQLTGIKLNFLNKQSVPKGSSITMLGLTMSGTPYVATPFSPYSVAAVCTTFAELVTVRIILSWCD